VRNAFTAEFSCERERANAPCMPIRPLVLRFSNRWRGRWPRPVRLKPAAGGAGVAPNVRQGRQGRPRCSDVSFAGPLPERAAFTVELPRT
jgi:hypothetical protein